MKGKSDRWSPLDLKPSPSPSWTQGSLAKGSPYKWPWLAAPASKSSQNSCQPCLNCVTGQAKLGVHQKSCRAMCLIRCQISRKHVGINAPPRHQKAPIWMEAKMSQVYLCKMSLFILFTISLIFLQWCLVIKNLFFWSSNTSHRFDGSLVRFKFNWLHLQMGIPGCHWTMT